MFEIPLFKAEKEAGFTSENLAKASINYLVELEKNDSFDVKKLDQKFLDRFKLVANTEYTPDLFPIKSVLVTTVWNGNDDIFHPYEVWAARNTATDKPFNYEHSPDDIIGHTTASIPIDDEGKELSGSLTLDELPKKFHILNYDVLYAHWGKNEDKQQRCDKIIAEIANWCVSVEALFANFDYGVKDESGNIKIIQRNENTSFLTKLLKCYNGNGTFESQGKTYRLGRVPRNMIFSGKGLTKKPANSESIILAKKYSENFDLNLQNKNVVYSISIDNPELSKIMATQTDKNEVVEAKIMDAVKENVELKAEIAKLQASLAEINVKGYKDEIADLKQKLEARTQEVVSVTELQKTAKAELEKVSVQLKDVEKVKAELTEKFNKIEAEKKVAERYALVVAKLKLNDEKAKKLVANLTTLSDEAFAANIDMQAEILAASVTTPVQTEDEKKKAELAAKAEEEKKALEQLEAAKKTEKDAALSTKPNDNSGVEKIREDVTKYLRLYASLDSDESKTE